MGSLGILASGVTEGRFSLCWGSRGASYGLVVSYIPHAFSRLHTSMYALPSVWGILSPKALLETLNMTCLEEIAQESEDTWFRLSLVHLKILHSFVNLCTLIYTCVSQRRCGSPQVTFRNKLLATTVWNSVVERRSAILGSEHRFHWAISMAHSRTCFFYCL